MRREAFACFDCQVSFKRGDEVETLVCPRCSGTMHRMGWSFHAPLKRDREQWKKVQILFAEGFRFYGSGSSDQEPIPDTHRDVPDFLERNQKHRLRVAERKPELLP